MPKNDAAFAFRRGYWLRQLSDCAESDFAAVLVTLKQYGGTAPALYAKCMDGTTWQGQIDSKTPINTVTDVKLLQSQCWDAGVAFSPVVVPRGETGESAAHGALAEAIGCIVVDIEAGAGFYDGAPTSTIPAYFQQLRQAAPDSFIMGQPDPRNLSSVYFDQSVPSLDGVAAQHYIGWDSVGWTDVVAEVESFDAIHARGLPCYPTLYGEGDGATVSTFWRAVKDYSRGLQFFRFGVMGPAEFSLARSCLLPGEAIP